jgi:hypothetical protein
MQTYLMTVVLRSDLPSGEEQGPEWEYQCTNVRALNEVEARRIVLEQSWKRGFLVSTIKDVKVRTNNNKQ